MTALLTLLSLAGCSTPAPTGPSPVAPAKGPESVLLARHPERITITELGWLTRPGRALKAKLPVTATKIGPGRWKVDLQVRAPGHHHPVKKRVPGTRLTQGKRTLKWERRPSKPWTWTVDEDGDLIVRLPPRNDGKGLVFHTGRMRGDERALDRRTAGGTDLDFVVRDQPIFQDWRHGLYIPPPTTLRIDVDVPSGRATFTTRARLLTPVWGPSRSDGTDLALRVVDGENVETVGTWGIDRGQRVLTADLSRWAGRRVTLELQSEPRTSAAHDHLFLEEPLVHVPNDTPRRVLLVFVDTLRADHLGLYGYGRDTSPTLDQLATHGMVFENAHGTAPWTLPSSRSLLTGRQPEAVDEAAKLQELFAGAGFTTASIYANHYLGEGFGLEHDWSSILRQPQSSSYGTRAATELLKRYPDRDLFVLLHLMDPHMPYGERREHRLWSDAPPDILPGSHATQEWKLEEIWAEADADERVALQTWATDRYDQNIHQVDADLRPVFEAFGPDTTVVFVSDHGERLFGDDGTYGHGQGLEDDLMRVPMIWWGPGITAGRTDQHVSLLDVAPTLLERFGLPVPEPMDGRSLLPTLDGGEQPAEPVGFGHILYGDQGWAAVEGGTRYETRGPKESVTGSGDGVDTWRKRASEATGRELVPVWRISVPSRTTRMADVRTRWTLEHPGGVGRVWGSEDGLGGIHLPTQEGDVLTAQPSQGRHMPREVFFDRSVDLMGAKVTYAVGEQSWSAVVDTSPADQPVLIGPAGAELRLDAGVAALAVELEEQVLTDTTAEELRALGYIE